MSNDKDTELHRKAQGMKILLLERCLDEALDLTDILATCHAVMRESSKPTISGGVKLSREYVQARNLVLREVKERWKALEEEIETANNINTTWVEGSE